MLRVSRTPPSPVSYLVVTHLASLDASQRSLVEHRLAALGLLRCLVDSRNEAHVLPPDTFGGLFNGATALELRRTVAEQVREALADTLSEAVEEAKVFVAVGRHGRLWRTPVRRYFH